MPVATSMRRPSTPRANQWRMTSSNSARTSSHSQFRSGWEGSNKCRYHQPLGSPSASGSCDHAAPEKTDCQSLGGCCPAAPRPRTQWKRRQAPVPGASASASWNQACSEEQWFGTMSMMTLMPAPWHWAMSASKSASVPKRGSMCR